MPNRVGVVKDEREQLRWLSDEWNKSLNLSKRLRGVLTYNVLEWGLRASLNKKNRNIAIFTESVRNDSTRRASADNDEVETQSLTRKSETIGMNICNRETYGIYYEIVDRRYQELERCSINLQRVREYRRANHLIELGPLLSDRTLGMASLCNSQDRHNYCRMKSREQAAE